MSVCIKLRQCSKKRLAHGNRLSERLGVNVAEINVGTFSQNRTDTVTDICSIVNYN